MKPRVSIIICTLNREMMLCSTLQRVVELIKDREDCELIVVDQTLQHSRETEQCLAGLAPFMRLMRVGFASLTKARNVGLQQARGEIVLFLDDDVEPSTGLIDSHVACYAEETVWGVAGCTLLPGRRKLSPKDLTTRELRDLELDRHNRFDLDWSRLTTWAPGCNMSFRVSRIFDVGGFDEAFYGMAVGEEAELCYRLRQSGGQIVYSPDAELIHLVDPNGGCRDARAEAERTAQLLDNALYMLCRTRHSWFRTCEILASQCRVIVFNRKSIAQWAWPRKLSGCVKGLWRAFKGKDRPPVLPLSTARQLA